MWFEDRPAITNGDYSAFDVNLANAANSATSTVAQDLQRDPAVAAVVDVSQPVTLYNLVASKGTTFNNGIIDSSDTDNRTLYTGFEVNFSTRLPGGAMLFGSWTAEHTLQDWCDTDDNPNGPTSTGQFSASDATTGVAASFGGRYCDQTQFTILFATSSNLRGTIRCCSVLISAPCYRAMPEANASFCGRHRRVCSLEAERSLRRSW
jgi:hypothetical protein